MGREMIMGIPALNFQAIVGMIFFAVTVFLVKIIRGIQKGKYPGSSAMIFYLRTLLWVSMIGSMMLFFGAILGIRYI